MFTKLVMLALMIIPSAYSQALPDNIVRSLRREGINPSQLQSKGLRIILGETSGAGKLVSTSKVRGVFTSKRLYFVNARNMRPMGVRTLGRTREVSHNRGFIPANAIKAVLIKQ